MKLSVLLFAFLALAAATAAYTAAAPDRIAAPERERMANDGLDGQNPAPCGLEVTQLEVDIDVVGETVRVLVSAHEGAFCRWCGLEVTVWMRDARTGLWAGFPGYSGPEKSWISDPYLYHGFDRISVTARAYDVPKPVPPAQCGCSHDTNPPEAHAHLATRSLIQDL